MIYCEGCPKGDHGYCKVMQAWAYMLDECPKDMKEPYKIQCFETNEIFVNERHCTTAMRLDPINLKNNLKGVTKRCSGLTFKKVKVETNDKI